MKKRIALQFALSHSLLAVLVLMLFFVPKQRTAIAQPWAMLAALLVVESVFLIKNRKNSLCRQGSCDIILFVWLLLIAWELCTSILASAHPVLIPSPENVFYTLFHDWKKMIINIVWSLELLSIGFASGMAASILLGLIVGWLPRLRSFAYPIANVLAPIPAVVFSPYLVSLMPSFRSAAVLVIFLGVFWPNFLGTINRVQGIEPRILDSARMLNLNNGTMIFKVLLPYVIPSVISGLKVSVTTSVLMLNFAELMGATHGLGYYIQNSITYANYTQAVAGIIVIGMVVTIMNRMVEYVQKHAIRWR